MKFYLAPMEGVTGYIYRNAYHAHFRPMDKYFTPFLAPKHNGGFSHREINDILPEHNEGMDMVPQLLTGNSEDFLRAARELKEYGYKEVNLNLGCPSGTVAAKGKGAGFLRDPEGLELFLEQVCEGMERLGLELSVKTRLGIEEPEEFDRLLSIYNRFPLKELIIHPRVLKDFYKYTPRMEAFRNAFANSAAPVCYNGDIVDRESYERLTAAYPALDAVMIGRGLLADPFLIETLSGQAGTESRRTQIERLSAFHQQILEGYCQTMSGDKNVLFKMKELWTHLIHFDPEWEPYIKKIRKAQRLGEYKIITGQMFRERKAAL